MLKRQAPDHQRNALYQLRIVTRLFALLVVILLVVGYFLPKDYHISRTTKVSVPLAQVDVYLSKAKNLPDWMYVLNGQIEKRDEPLIKGLELAIQYESGDLGSLLVGELFTRTYHFSVVPKEGQRPVSNEIQLESLSDNETLVSWSIDGVLESGLLSPYLALFANDIAGANFEKSLSQLKQELEN